MSTEITDIEKMVRVKSADLLDLPQAVQVDAIVPIDTVSARKIVWMTEATKESAKLLYDISLQLRKLTRTDEFVAKRAHKMQKNPTLVNEYDIVTSIINTRYCCIKMTCNNLYCITRIFI